MEEGWLEFSMHAPLAETFMTLRRELDDIIYQKVCIPAIGYM
jgi:hypothetical protein